MPPQVYLHRVQVQGWSGWRVEVRTCAAVANRKWPWPEQDSLDCLASLHMQPDSWSADQTLLRQYLESKTQITYTSLKHSLILKLSLGMTKGFPYPAGLGPNRWSGNAGSVLGCSAPQGGWVEWRAAAGAREWTMVPHGFYKDHLTGRPPEKDCGETRSGHRDTQKVWPARREKTKKTQKQNRNLIQS